MDVTTCLRIISVYCLKWLQINGGYGGVGLAKINGMLSELESQLASETLGPQR